MRKIARHVAPSATVSVIKEDPEDNRILECATEARSEYIVTGDNDLLRVQRYGDVRIVKVAEFFKGGLTF